MRLEYAWLIGRYGIYCKYKQRIGRGQAYIIINSAFECFVCVCLGVCVCVCIYVCVCVSLVDKSEQSRKWAFTSFWYYIISLKVIDIFHFLSSGANDSSRNQTLYHKNVRRVFYHCSYLIFHIFISHAVAGIKLLQLGWWGEWFTALLQSLSIPFCQWSKLDF